MPPKKKAPVVKKAASAPKRSKHDDDVSSSDDHEEAAEVIKPRGSRSRPKKPVMPAKSDGSASPNDDDDDDDLYTPASKAKKGGKAAKSAPANKGKKNPPRKRSKPIIEKTSSEEDDFDNDFEVIKPRSSRSRPIKSIIAPKVEASESEEEAVEDEKAPADEEKPAVKNENSKEKGDEAKKNKSAGGSGKKSGGKIKTGVESPEKEAIIRKVVVKNGSAPVDPECHSKLATAHVYSENGTIYDAMLNQTNIGFNNNKFYIIQLLEDDNSKNHSIWFRWGRVGKVGQHKLESHGSNLDAAKASFHRKFFDKTKNDWADRDSFVKIPGRYDLLIMDYKASSVSTASNTSNVIKKEPTLPLPIRALITLICDVKLMESTVVEMEYNAQKAPLGRLTKQQIQAGYEALKLISDIISKKTEKRKDLIEACSDFYTRIPHDFGMRPPPLITTPQDIKKKLELLEALSDIEIAMNVINQSTDEHPLDRNYKSLDCEIKDVPKSSDTSNIYHIIETYLHRTHGSTHSNYTLTLLEIFEVSKPNEHQRFVDVGNRMLLWHGSRLSNWMGILTQGLRVAPPEAPVTGYMFGKGVYFADISSKSANYVYPTRSRNEGLLVLCEVALGKCNELTDAKYDAHKLPAGTHSVKGLGQIVPNPVQDLVLPDGVVVPWGNPIKTTVSAASSYTLNYNEFIVYNVNQIKMRYLVRVKFNFV